MRNLAVIVAVSALLVGCAKPQSTSRDVSSNNSDSIPSDYKLANPCPHGVASVYLRPDGTYVVRNVEDQNHWIQITMTPEEYCRMNESKVQ